MQGQIQMVEKSMVISTHKHGFRPVLGSTACAILTSFGRIERPHIRTDAFSYKSLKCHFILITDALASRAPFHETPSYLGPAGAASGRRGARSALGLRDAGAGAGRRPRPARCARYPADTLLRRFLFCGWGEGRKSQSESNVKLHPVLSVVASIVAPHTIPLRSTRLHGSVRACACGPPAEPLQCLFH